MGACVAGHVGQQAAYRRLCLSQQLEGLDVAQQRQVVGLGDDDHPVDVGHVLEKALDLVAGRRRAVHHEPLRIVVPRDRARRHLLDRLQLHLAAPHVGRVLGEEQPDREELQPVHPRRPQLCAQQRVVARVLHEVHRPGQGAAVHVNVENPDLVAAPRERVGEADGGGGLADAALHGHGDEGFPPRCVSTVVHASSPHKKAACVRGVPVPPQTA